MQINPKMQEKGKKSKFYPILIKRMIAFLFIKNKKN